MFFFFRLVRRGPLDLSPAVRLQPVHRGHGQGGQAARDDAQEEAQ